MVSPGDLELYKDIGIAGTALVIVIGLSRWVAIRSFQYIEKANDALTANQNQFIHFAEETLNKNTLALSELTMALATHTREKDEAISMLKGKDKTISELFEMLKQEIKQPRNRREY